MQENRYSLKSILENVTMTMIVLVLLQTFLEEFSVFARFHINTIFIIRLSAIIFDLYFSVEFIVRMVFALKKEEGKRYFLQQNGWIDLLASIPLLLFISGPYFINQIFNINLLNTNLLNMVGLLKIVKAIRVARILRLMRVLKIMKNIKNVHSKMGQYHTTYVATVIVTTIIFLLIFTSILQAYRFFPSIEGKMVERELETNNLFKELFRMSSSESTFDLFSQTSKNISSIYSIENKGEKVFQSSALLYINLDRYQKVMSPEIVKTYLLNEEEQVKITYFRLKDYQYEAFMSMFYFLLIIFVLFTFIIKYTGHFALTVTDPIFIMCKGFEKREFINPVEIPGEYRDFDIFQLANDYNKWWIPTKVKALNKLKSSTSNLLLNMKNKFNQEVL